MSRTRISRARLQKIQSDLSERDVKIIESVATNRFLTSHQIRRTHFLGHASETASIRSTNRALARLADLGVIDHLKRRVGGVRAGSGSNVWSLTETGARLLKVTSGFERLPARLRMYEPTTTFLEHTLAVAEVCLRLAEAATGGEFSIIDLQREPESWRTYSGRHGGVVTLKPDLALVTGSGDFEDHWFLEIDRNTEPPSRIIRTCRRYEDYRQAATEQKRIGVFPAVVWVTPDVKRSATLARHIAGTAGLSWNLYAVVQLSDLPSLIQAGIGLQEAGRET